MRSYDIYLKLILKINTKEQIFVEKLVSLLSHGIGSTRYKDIYDFYYFITETKLDNIKVLKLIDLYLFKNNAIGSINDIHEELSIIFDNRAFKNNLKSSKYNWIEVEPELATKTILEYIKSLEGLLVHN